MTDQDKNASIETDTSPSPQPCPSWPQRSPSSLPYCTSPPSPLPTAKTNSFYNSLIFSPLLSYTDQILAIHRTRTSAGFSLDIPLIMLSASILKIFYYPGARYDIALLIQAIVMTFVQLILLKVALDNRPAWRDQGPFKSLDNGLRPWNFWRWRAQRP